MYEFQIFIKVVQLDPRNHALRENDIWIVHDTCESECPAKCQNLWKIQDRNNSNSTPASEIVLKCEGII